MYDHSLFLRTVSELSGRLVTPSDVDAVLTETVARLAEVFDLAGAGVALAEEGELRPTVGFPAAVDALEQIQNEQQAGPCVEAFRSGEILAIPDLEAYAGRWPAYCAAARDRRLGSVVGVPLRLGAESVGAVDLYAAGRRAWPPADLEAAVVLADLVTAYLVNTSRLREHEQRTEQLQGALESRVVIEQAKGVLAARRNVPVDDAFELIRRHARTHQVTVRAVCEGIVNLGLQV